jgi:hypothetical protein
MRHRLQCFRCGEPRRGRVEQNGAAGSTAAWRSAPFKLAHASGSEEKTKLAQGSANGRAGDERQAGLAMGALEAMDQAP